jgi:hypothetical protein
MDDRRRDRIAIWALAALCLLLGALLAITVVYSSGVPPRRGADGPGPHPSSDPSTPKPTASDTPAGDETPAPGGGSGRGSGGGSAGGTGIGGGTGSGGGTVSQPSPSYTISGTLVQQLRPGDTYPLDLGLTNLGGVAMTVVDLRVTISHVTAPHATASHPCTLNDFAATQVATGFSVDLLASESTTLSARGIPSAQWPQLSMLNTSANQDGCKGATLALTFTGSSTVTP